jgi:hypothetical protein
MSNGEIYDRTIEDESVTIPDHEAGKEVCVVDNGAVLAYVQVQKDGTVEVEHPDGLDVRVIAPSDEQFEEHA